MSYILGDESRQSTMYDQKLAHREPHTAVECDMHRYLELSRGRLASWRGSNCTCLIACGLIILAVVLYFKTSMGAMWSQKWARSTTQKKLSKIWSRRPCETKLGPEGFCVSLALHQKKGWDVGETPGKTGTKNRTTLQ